MLAQTDRLLVWRSLTCDAPGLDVRSNAEDGSARTAATSLKFTPMGSLPDEDREYPNPSQ